MINSMIKQINRTKETKKEKIELLDDLEYILEN